MSSLWVFSSSLEPNHHNESRLMGCIWNSEQFCFKAQQLVNAGADVLTLHRQKRALTQPVWTDMSLLLVEAEFSVQGGGSRPAVDVRGSTSLRCHTARWNAPHFMLSYKCVHTCIHSTQIRLHHYLTIWKMYAEMWILMQNFQFLVSYEVSD